MTFITRKKKGEKKSDKKIAHSFKIYPTELKVCTPVIIKQWSWTELKTIRIVVHKFEKDKIEITKIE